MQDQRRDQGRVEGCHRHGGRTAGGHADHGQDRGAAQLPAQGRGGRGEACRVGSGGQRCAPVAGTGRGQDAVAGRSERGLTEREPCPEVAPVEDHDRASGARGRPVLDLGPSDVGQPGRRVDVEGRAQRAWLARAPLHDHAVSLCRAAARRRPYASPDPPPPPERRLSGTCYPWSRWTARTEQSHGQDAEADEDAAQRQRGHQHQAAGQAEHRDRPAPPPAPAGQGPGAGVGDRVVDEHAGAGEPDGAAQVGDADDQHHQRPQDELGPVGDGETRVDRRQPPRQLAVAGHGQDRPAPAGHRAQQQAGPGRGGRGSEGREDPGAEHGAQPHHDGVGQAELTAERRLPRRRRHRSNAARRG